MEDVKMSCRLRELRSDKKDGGFWNRYGQSPLIRARLNELEKLVSANKLVS